MKNLPHVVAEAESLVLRHIVEAYTRRLSSRDGQGQLVAKSEPKITISAIAEFLRHDRFTERNAPWHGNKLQRQWLYNLAKTVLRRLTRLNLLRESTGIGWNGKEALMFDPTPAGKAEYKSFSRRTSVCAEPV